MLVVNLILKVYLILAIIVKAYLHTYIADRSNIYLGGGGHFSFKVLWFYNLPVPPEYVKSKKYCNQLQLHNIIILIIILILSIIN